MRETLEKLIIDRVCAFGQKVIRDYVVPYAAIIYPWSFSVPRHDVPGLVPYMEGTLDFSCGCFCKYY